MSDANNIEPKCDTAIENSLFNDNIPFINKNKLCNNIGLSLVGFNLNSESMDPLARYWTEHYAQLGVPIFNTTDARTWSIHEVASYVQKVVTSNKSDSQNTNEDVRISDRFIDQVQIHYYFYCRFIHCLISDYFFIGN